MDISSVLLIAAPLALVVLALAILIVRRSEDAELDDSGEDFGGGSWHSRPKAGSRPHCGEPLTDERGARLAERFAGREPTPDEDPLSTFGRPVPGASFTEAAGAAEPGPEREPAEAVAK